MPLFDFKCNACGFTREALVSPGDIALSITCACGGTMDRQLSMPAAFPDADRWRNPAKGKNWKKVINNIRRRG